MPYDALLLVSFGGPEGPEDVLPFLENVTRGRGIPRERLAEVGRHYELFGGVSPINGQNRELLAALRERLAPLPVYWGNRNWEPYLADTLRQMQADGIERAAAYVTSAYSSYSGCRQYREDIARAREEVGPAPEVDKLRVFYNHPLFVGCFVDATLAALAQLPAELRAGAHLAFTAHSIPLSMAGPSAYEAQLRETARLVTAAVGDHPWSLAWNSRSGPPQVPWLEPDISDELTAIHAAGAQAAVIVPIGFVSDHMEVVYDLDTVAVPDAPMPVVRAATPGSDPRVVELVAELLAERQEGLAPRWLGPRGPSPVACLAGCCPAPARPASVSPGRPAGR